MDRAARSLVAATRGAAKRAPIDPTSNSGRRETNEREEEEDEGGGGGEKRARAKGGIRRGGEEGDGHGTEHNVDVRPSARSSGASTYICICAQYRVLWRQFTQTCEIFSKCSCDDKSLFPSVDRLHIYNPPSYEIPHLCTTTVILVRHRLSEKGHLHFTAAISAGQFGTAHRPPATVPVGVPV